MIFDGHDQQRLGCVGFGCSDDRGDDQETLYKPHFVLAFTRGLRPQ